MRVKKRIEPEMPIFYLMRKIARACQTIKMIWVSRFIWKNMAMACDYCGALVGMRCSISRFGMTCWPCLENLKSTTK